jgi:hypothetical protein
LEERCGLRGVLRNDGAFLVEKAQSRAAFHGAVLAPLLKERAGASRVAFHTAAALVDDAETGASVADTAFARFREQLGGTAIVLQNVLALLQLQRELVAGGGVSGIAGVAQLLGLGVSGVASRECDAGDCDEEKESVRACCHVRRGLRVA